MAWVKIGKICKLAKLYDYISYTISHNRVLAQTSLSGDEVLCTSFLCSFPTYCDYPQVSHLYLVNLPFLLFCPCAPFFLCQFVVCSCCKIPCVFSLVFPVFWVLDLVCVWILDISVPVRIFFYFIAQLSLM